MGISIAVNNRKGGTGKTTVAIHLAGNWAQLGYRVCLIDTDAQGSAGESFGIRPTDGLFNLMCMDAELKDVMVPISPARYAVPDQKPEGSLFLLPGGMRTAAIPSMVSDPFTLNDYVEVLKQTFDIVLIDMAPTFTALDAYSYLASDYFVVVTQVEALSLEGTRKSMQEIERFASRRQKSDVKRGSHVLCIVPNMVDARLSIHRTLLEDLVAEYGDLVAPPIYNRVAYKEASAFQELVYVYRPTGEDTDAMRRVAMAVEKAANNVQV